METRYSQKELCISIGSAWHIFAHGEVVLERKKVFLIRTMKIGGVLPTFMHNRVVVRTLVRCLDLVGLVAPVKFPLGNTNVQW